VRTDLFLNNVSCRKSCDKTRHIKSQRPIDIRLSTKPIVKNIVETWATAALGRFWTKGACAAPGRVYTTAA
jgi:hypothetical protein